ncbi:MAG: hypothetical protein A3J06_02535 [Candidatus Moranbacteria bacterium RIFCSPLOWO2_02_FULL_48_19]|nr:MAG: hypothetical protein A3J06_02535 [Candidatus Moranbacteria bacterium RIFCSPLOWO2_02_FULL_48_19]OGI29792.1 MAG: hypothetical protein A3G09_02020 [Candidatus Moranbacteria bacterium RIFCSPLOWO2_12_FULL_48_12]
MSIRKESITFFEKMLLDFYQKAGREHLPWRTLRKASPRGAGKAGKITAYEVWVAEVMLQQTQVSRVISYYKRFLKRFPTVQKLARVSWEKFLPCYQGLGYYTRGRNMLKTAKEIVNKYHGKFPRDKKLLEDLPGIGPYTAAAIMSFAYGDNHLAWDTNLKRVIGRFFFGTKNYFSSSSPLKGRVGERYRKKNPFSISHFSHPSPSRTRELPSGRGAGREVLSFSLPAKILNAALMDFGSALCVSRPKCGACALRSRCVYYAEGGKREIGNKKLVTGENKKEDWGNARVVLFLHENHKKYFSADKKKFQPFFLPAAYNTRASIKKYFQETYQLILSVRPPYERAVRGGKPALLVNAQILLGEPSFRVFSKEAREEYNEKLGRFPSRRA